MKNLDQQPDDDMAEIQRHIGMIWMKREKYEEALSMFEDALKIKVPLSQDGSTDQFFHQHLMECFDGALEAVAILFGSDHLRYAKVSLVRIERMSLLSMAVFISFCYFIAIASKGEHPWRQERTPTCY